MKVLAAFILIFVGFEASANNMIIPNHYRARRDTNSFAALGWCTRKEVNAFYINPQLEFGVEKNESSGLETEVKTLSLSLETGYRLKPVQAFVRFSHEKEGSEISSSNYEATKNGFLVGGSYFF